MTYPQQGAQWGGQYGGHPQGGGGSGLVAKFAPLAIVGLGVVGFLMGFGDYVSYKHAPSSVGTSFFDTEQYPVVLLLIGGIAAAICVVTKEKWGVGIAAATGLSVAIGQLCGLLRFGDGTSAGWAYWIVFVIALAQGVLGAVVILTEKGLIGGASAPSAAVWGGVGQAPQPGRYGQAPQPGQYGQAAQPGQYGQAPQSGQSQGHGFGAPAQPQQGQPQYGRPAGQQGQPQYGRPAGQQKVPQYGGAQPAPAGGATPGQGHAGGSGQHGGASPSPTPGQYGYGSPQYGYGASGSGQTPSAGGPSVPDDQTRSVDPSENT